MATQNKEASTGPSLASLQSQGIRRSQRVFLTVPISVYGWSPGGEVFHEETTTVVVNGQGALITLKNKVAAKQELFVRNDRTGDEAKCYVANIGSTEGDRTEVGVGFVGNHPAFWQVHFPPDEGSPLSRKNRPRPGSSS